MEAYNNHCDNIINYTRAEIALIDAKIHKLVDGKDMEWAKYWNKDYYVESERLKERKKDLENRVNNMINNDAIARHKQFCMHNIEQLTSYMITVNRKIARRNGTHMGWLQEWHPKKYAKWLNWCAIRDKTQQEINEFQRQYNAL